MTNAFGDRLLSGVMKGINTKNPGNQMAVGIDISLLVDLIIQRQEPLPPHR